MSSIPAARETRSIETPDGLTIASTAFGPKDGPPLLFIHGFSQSSLCWTRQTASPLLADCRIVTYDFRGHGASERPYDPEVYRAPKRWAGELDAVIRGWDLQRPILVGWSYAGRIIGDYLSIHGTQGISGIVFVDAIVSGERRFFGSCNRLMRLMCSTDVEENIAATRTFVRRCFANPIPQPLFELMFGVNMLVPPQVRSALFGREMRYEAELAAIDVPTLAVHGALDEVIAPAMAEHIAQVVPGARLELFAGVGHAPFLEAADRFNALLADFAAGIAARR
ncbi:alpha/beta hydrolase [Xanthobacter sp. KR7-65]|uniref:alpha/beta fold hydrolase n=1 Tax=Xanthobacter sp. KR7-65 TaxID=3156612 RepID=UPI0032B59A19